MIDNVTGMWEWMGGLPSREEAVGKHRGGPASLYESLGNGKDIAPKASRERLSQWRSGLLCTEGFSLGFQIVPTLFDIF